MKYFHKIIEDICNEENIEYRYFSKDWVIQLKRDGEYRYIVGSGCMLNKQGVHKILSDKYATYDILKNSGIPIFEHNIIFNKKFKYDCEQDIAGVRDIKKYIKKQRNKKIVVKSNGGYGGKEVFLCTRASEAKRIIKKIFEKRTSASIMPFYDVETEIRSIYLNGNIELMYGKYKDNKEWKFNLSQGAMPKIIEDEELKNKVSEMAKEIAKLLDIKFASIDIAKLKTGELMVVEVNSSVAMQKFIELTEDGYNIAKEIYKKAIFNLFE